MDKITIPFIAKNPEMGIDVGLYNGYVAVSPKSKFYGITYDNELYDLLDAPGGISLSEPVILGEYTAVSHLPIKTELVGKRTHLVEVAIRIDGSKDPIPDDWWIIGFDTMHFGDTSEKWDESSVSLEVRKLEKQIIQVGV